MAKVVIDHEDCEGAECAECVDVCPMEILVVDEDKIKVHNAEECNECEVCVDVCPEDCIEIN
ncbi:MAG: 4Fe-4S dicluster domain-containing protein [Euryarchaeota archaeon]|nr:4Fe-4S dicluster domain-containing protein [Euryarchaeota archaeon]MBV1729690.1 4Fe-4S dicluster domain-containing protein [Methanobacterium sp.]MBU4548161.1 4Fe-4S dicluster domain-containing protein [Euryarchaeota archaeon]MBU4607523.1 4Fe-4S dicluster domain-containing protein [Euryarchaeota archaeon]MBV1754435.1 4Fe-4S dicluster domain-containing protein [Methanobacterium sp.]